jgi:hypothetical protein
MEERQGPSSRSGLVGGLVLVGIGLFMLGAQVVPNVGRLLPLGVGVALLAAGIVRRAYGLIIPGCIVSGVGAGVALGGWFPEAPGGALVLLSLAGGFFAIWGVAALLGMPGNHWWPFVPGTAIGITGLAVLSASAVEDVLRLWPVALVVIGLLLVGSTLLPRDEPDR